MELFSEEDRLSLIYGKNGSRKSTISKAIHKAKGDTVEDIERADLYDGENKAYSDIQGVHVFNEDYVNSRVKIREDGLNTIVLLGELGNLEDKILDLEFRIEAESNRNAELKIVADEYKDRDSKKSLFLTDGEVPIDDPASERALRNFTIGRKNWVTINTVRGAQVSAVIYSITETARANDLNVYYYIRHLLTELPQLIREDGNIGQPMLEPLMPWSGTLPADRYSKRCK